MANIRCPMCSKINPPDAQVCGYCGARLKPVRPGAPSEPETPAANAPSQPSGGEPDWLSQFRGDKPAAPAKGAPQANEPSGQGGEEPDWLSRIRDRARTETSSTPSDLFKEEQEAAPDWMQGASNEPSADLGGDWLSRLQDDAGTTTPAKEPPAAGQGSVPLFADSDQEDWLRGLTDNTAAGPGDEAPMFDFGALSDDAAPQTGKSQAPSAGTGSASEDDWMSKLSAWQTDLGQAPAGQEPAASEGTDDFGWLNNLGPADQPPQTEPPAEEPGGFGLTSFLSGIDDSGAAPQGAAPKEASQEHSGFGMTGFLSGLDQPGAPQEPASGEGSSGALIFGEGELQWNPPEEPPAGGPPSGELNFSDLFSSEPEGEKPATGEYNESTFTGWTPEASAESSDLPDWLGGAPSAAAPAGPAAADSGMPDWLRAMESETSAAPAEAQPASVDSTPAEDSSVPDWLRGISAAPAAQPVEESPAGGETGLPSWLDGLETPAAPEQPVQPEIVQPGMAGPSEEGGLPDWLASFDQPAGAGAAAFAAAEAAAEPESPVSSTEASAAPVEGLPDWFASVAPTNVEKTQPYRTGGLKGEQPPEAAQPPAGPAAESAALFVEPAAEDENVPNWLRAFHEQPATGESVPPLIGGEQAIENPAVVGGEQPFEMDLPDWLSEEAKPAEVRDQQTAEPSGEQLAQAELPEWVKEMRPIESIIPGEAQMAEADQRVEKAGPLAGMRGVLPAEDLVTRYRKPPTYSVKLRVSEKQRGQSSIFDSILQQENQPLLIPPERSFAPGAMLRLLIALLLIAALFIPIFLGGSFAPLAMPAIYPAELQKMFNQIDQNTQSSSAPVLLAVDYEPGLSGEMRLSSLGVIKHLMAKNVPIVVISTVPTGPALAQQLLSEAQVSNTSYDLKQQVINLGYLPGGTMSLLEFAQLPRFAAPVTLAGASAWQNTFISEISSLQGFSQVIVLTDRAETGRSWVEQVAPSMGSVPLYMVASAQASPLLYPYYESGQIDGMVSGQLGGAMYSQQAKQENTPALNYLAAYQVGLILAFGLVLVGGLVSGSMALFKRGKKSEE